MTVTFQAASWRSVATLLLVTGRSVCILPKFKSGNGAIVHLVRTVGQPHGAHRSVIARQSRIVGDAGGAVGLDRVVDDPQRHVRTGNLDHGDLELRGLVADL